MNVYGALIIGYAFALLVALLTGLVLNRMGVLLGISEDDRPGKWTAILVGFVERLLYVTTILHGNPGFIGVWLAAKVAGGWSKWQEDRKKYFQPFLTGNGLSIAYSFVGAKMINWLSSNNIEKAIFSGVGLVGFMGLALVH